MSQLNNVYYAEILPIRTQFWTELKQYCEIHNLLLTEYKVGKVGAGTEGTLIMFLNPTLSNSAISWIDMIISNMNSIFSPLETYHTVKFYFLNGWEEDKKLAVMTKIMDKWGFWRIDFGHENNDPFELFRCIKQEYARERETLPTAITIPTIPTIPT